MKFTYSLPFILLAFLIGGNVASAATCTGNVHTNLADAQSCAAIAQAEAQARGYTASCSAVTVGSGASQYINSTCTINGTTGHSAYLLAGYDNPNSLVSHINPGWASLPALVGTVSLTSGNTIGTSSGTAGANTIVSLSTGFVLQPKAYSSTVLKQINSSLDRILTMYNVILQNGMPIIPTTPTPTATPTPVTPVSTVPATSPQQFRYLKVSTTENYWVSWREIEVYDLAGNRIPNITAVASATYGSEVAGRVLDSNLSTVWNAGETNPSCIFPTGISALACPTSSRSAWIQLDLGSVKDVSKVVLVQNANTQSEVDTLTISSDGVNYRFLTSFKAPIRDSERLIWPAPVYAGDPVVSLTANGGKNITVEWGRGVNYMWSTSNADYITISGTGARDPSYTSTLSASDQSICDRQNANSYAGALNPFVSAEMLPINGSKSGFMTEGCRVGYILTIRASAHQRYTGKVSTDSVTIKVTPTASDTLYNVSVQPNPSTISRGSSATVDLFAFGVVPVSFSNATLPSGVTISLPQQGQRTMTISVSQSAIPGLYFIPVIANGNGAIRTVDVGVIVE
jgi:hypothetical protein